MAGGTTVGFVLTFSVGLHARNSGCQYTDSPPQDLKLNEVIPFFQKCEDFFIILLMLNMRVKKQGKNPNALLMPPCQMQAPPTPLTPPASVKQEVQHIRLHN